MALRIGDSEKIQAMSTEIARLAEEFSLRILASHAHLAAMSSDNSWNDEIHREYLVRFSDIRNQIDRQLGELGIVANDMRGVAIRYENLGQ